MCSRYYFCKTDNKKDCVHCASLYVKTCKVCKTIYLCDWHEFIKGYLATWLDKPTRTCFGRIIAGIQLRWQNERNSALWRQSQFDNVREFDDGLRSRRQVANQAAKYVAGSVVLFQQHCGMPAVDRILVSLLRLSAKAVTNACVAKLWIHPESGCLMVIMLYMSAVLCCLKKLSD